MTRYKEWEQFKVIEDKDNPFSTLYELEDGSRFYIEPIFYAYISNVFMHLPDRKKEILDEMNNIVKRNKLVIFSGMEEEQDEEPVTKNDKAVVRTIFDILDSLGIYLENKSRGSDYGD